MLSVFIELILQNSDNHVHACLGAFGTLKTVIHVHSEHDNMLINCNHIIKVNHFNLHAHQFSIVGQN